MFEKFLPEDEYGVVDRFVPVAPRPTLDVLRAPWRIATLARRYDPAKWTDDPRFAQFLGEVRDLAARDLTTMPWPQLKAMPREALALIKPIGDLRIDYLPRTGLALLRLFLVLRLLRRSALLADLLVGAPTRTTDANRALEVLAARARENSQLRETISKLDPKALAAFPEFEAEFKAYLAEYGHRETVTPVLVTPPTQGEAPETVLGLISVLAAEPPRPPEDANRAMSELLKHPLLRGSRRRRDAHRAMDCRRHAPGSRSARTATSTSSCRCRSCAGRCWRWAAGCAMSESSMNQRTSSICGWRSSRQYEDPSKLASTDPGRGEADSLRAAVRTRSARREELAGVRLIDPTAVFPQRDRGDALITGTPASSGSATGPVTVIRGPTEFSRLAPGDVLVCPYTNPAWTTLFQRAAAVVVDSGGPGSHAAIVAREYGIPAVMGTGIGTATLTDGQLVTVNGSTGRVTAAETDGQGR